MSSLYQSLDPWRRLWRLGHAQSSERGAKEERGGRGRRGGHGRVSGDCTCCVAGNGLARMDPGNEQARGRRLRMMRAKARCAICSSSSPEVAASWHAALRSRSRHPKLRKSQVNRNEAGDHRRRSLTASRRPSPTPPSCTSIAVIFSPRVDLGSLSVLQRLPCRSRPGH